MHSKYYLNFIDMGKRFYFLLGALFCLVCRTYAQLPTFSTDADEEWYVIQFTTGEAVLQDQGDGRNLQTAALGNDDSQRWKLLGSPESLHLVGKSGRYVGFSGSRFVATAAADEASDFALVQNGTSWELKYLGAADGDYAYLNQFGGTGAGRELGTWTAGDKNNLLRFVQPKEVVVPYSVRPIMSYEPEHKNTLWYTLPTTRATVENPWMEFALPIGNGQFGAMVYGGIAQEQIQFNDKTLWTGASTTAERGAYQNFGNVYVEDFSGVFGSTSGQTVQDYYRQLDLHTATASVHYKSPDKSVSYSREYIASYPDQVVAMRLAASEGGQISVRVSMDDAAGRSLPAYADGGGHFSGKLTTVSYDARLRVVPTGGTMTTAADGVTVSGADEVLIVLAGATDYDPTSLTYVSQTAQLADKVRARVDDAAAKGWAELYATHEADYRSLFDRVVFDFPTSENTMTTDRLVTRYNQQPVSSTQPYVLMLEQLYFNYGRYLMIASSRGVDLPSNLQGIWNNSSTPPWESDIHSNINVQMNYWPAEPTNLSELHLPFLNYLYNMAEVQPQWKAYARQSGQTTGWTCFTQNNIFGQSNWGENSVVANAWYSSHIWQHYRYTLDKDYLREKGFPVMLSAAKFWLERLIKDRRVNDGTWVCPDEYSPEQNNAAIIKQDATAYAQQLVADLLHNTLEAIRVLGQEEAGVDDAFVAELTEKYTHLDRGLHAEEYTGAWGATLNGVRTGDPLLREWKYSGYENGENGHRHLSHLMCLYPLGQINQSDSLFEAAVNSLKLRGDESTGWSMGWKINLWARALDGNHARRILRNALKHSTSYATNQYAGGIYYNLFDSHAPFQIDGNFGACSGVAEMLLQSYTDTLHLLPALPAQWRAGTIKGLKGVGDFTVDQTWANVRLTQAVITSGAGQECAVRYAGVAGAKVTDETGAEVPVTVVNDDVVKFATRKGGVYTLTFGGGEVGIRPDATAASGCPLTVSGRTLTAPDAVTRMSVADAKGRSWGTTSERTLTVDQGAGAVVLVRLDFGQGSAETYKVVLRDE